MTRPTPHLSAAIEELAAEARNRDCIVTAAMAKPHVDANVVIDWLCQSTAVSYPRQALSKLCAERLTDSQATSLLVAVVIGHTERVQDLLQAAVVDQVSIDLACAANKSNENDEPSDADLDRTFDPTAADRLEWSRVERESIYDRKPRTGPSYGSEVDDPVAADRRAVRG